MMPVVPFVSEASGGERKAWRDALPAALGDFAEVKPFADLTEAERQKATVAIVANPDPAKVAALPNLVWVQSLWAGVERLCRELPHDGPAIVRLTDPQMAETMSEAVLAWTLYLHRDMPRYLHQQREGVWKEHLLLPPEEKTVGVLGLGKLGEACALRLKANGFRVCGWSRSQKVIDGLETCHGSTGLTHLLSRSDFVVILVPLTDETRGLMDKVRFAELKPGAALINFARGPIVDTDALIAALDDGRLSHAVLDVFDQEPLPPESPLWQRGDVTILPHISAPTMVHSASKIVAENIRRYFESGEIPDAVDRLRGY